MPSTGRFSAQIRQIQTELQQADAIVVGAGAGLSAAAGLTYSGERFERYFSDFIKEYHYSDMYRAGFYPYPSPEAYWAYWSRHIYYNRYHAAPGQAYLDLLALVKDKNYFVITTNVDHQFQRAGFDKQRLFYTQGDYGLFQCCVPCHQSTYDNEQAVTRMVEQQKNLRIPTQLIPHCPVCGRPMAMNLRCDDTFVQDSGWHAALARYQAFLRRHQGLHILFLELGVGTNSPAVIKFPFWDLTQRNKHAGYVTGNLEEALCPPQIKPRSICLDADIGALLKALRWGGEGESGACVPQRLQ